MNKCSGVFFNTILNWTEQTNAANNQTNLWLEILMKTFFFTCSIMFFLVQNQLILWLWDPGINATFFAENIFTLFRVLNGQDLGASANDKIPMLNINLDLLISFFLFRLSKEWWPKPTENNKWPSNVSIPYD